MEDENTKNIPEVRNEPKEAQVQAENNINQAKNLNEKGKYKYLSVFERAGLNEKEAKIYEILIENGQLGVGDIIEKSSYKRGDSYNILYSLRDKGLIEQSLRSKKISFRAKHPNEIEEYIEDRYKKLERSKKEITNILPEITSIYNLTHSQPGVKVFEGKEGIERVVFDSLNSKGEIFSYIDIETVEKLISDSSNRYYKQRKELKLQKKNLIIESPFSTKFARNSQDDFTDTRILSGVTTPFKTTMTIYDNKISYITLKEGAMIGVIVEDKFIANMHKVLFKQAWDSATKLI